MTNICLAVESGRFRPIDHIGRNGYEVVMDNSKALELVEACLADIAKPGFTYPIVGVRNHEKVWAIAVQPTRPDGQPFYDIIGFDVDKVTGEVRQMV